MGGQRRRIIQSQTAGQLTLSLLKQTKLGLPGPNSAAARLGIKRPTLQFRMQKLGITRPQRSTAASTRHNRPSANWLAICQYLSISGSSLEFHRQTLLNVREKESIAQSANGLLRVVRECTRPMDDYLQTEIAAASRFDQSVSITSDALLVAQAQSGEHLAYAELCRRYRALVFRTAFRIIRNTEDAEDVLQDSWMRGFIHIGSFDGRSEFSTWLTRIAVNSALTMIRSRRNHREVSLDDSVDPDDCRAIEIAEPSRNPEEVCIETERLRLVRQAIRRLPPKLRSAIVHQSNGGSVSEVAMLAGVAIPTMKSRLFRARLRLRESVSRLLKEGSMSTVSPRKKEEGSVRRTSRRQKHSPKIASARNHVATNERSMPLNEEAVTSDDNKDSLWLIEQGSRVNCSVMQELGETKAC
jgi:RNA polymerase sigma factor (sigma-70 family)